MAKAITKDRKDNIFLRRIQKVSQNTGGFQLNPQALARYQELEAKYAADKNLEMSFGAVQDYLSQWQALPESQQKKLGKMYTDRATKLVDQYFIAEEKDLRGKLSRQLESLNTKYKFMDDAEKPKLLTSLAKLDRDTVRALGETFNNISERGLSNSGLLTQAVSTIMSDRQTAASEINSLFNLNKEQGNEAKAQDIGEYQANFDTNLRNLNYQKTATIEEKKNELISRDLGRDLAIQEASGVNTITPRKVAQEVPLRGQVEGYKPALAPIDTPVDARLLRARRRPQPTTNIDAQAISTPSVIKDREYMRNLRLSRMAPKP